MKDRLITQRIFFFGMVAILALILVWRFTRAILLAVALVIILKPIYTWLLQKKGINGKSSRATAMTKFIFILHCNSGGYYYRRGGFTGCNLFQRVGYRGSKFFVERNQPMA